MGKPCPGEFRDDIVRVAPGRDPGVTASKKMTTSGTSTATDLGPHDATVKQADVVSQAEPVPAVKPLCRPVRRIGESSSSEFFTNGRRSSRERWIGRGRAADSEVLHWVSESRRGMCGPCHFVGVTQVCRLCAVFRRPPCSIQSCFWSAAARSARISTGRFRSTVR